MSIEVKEPVSNYMFESRSGKVEEEIEKLTLDVSTKNEWI